MIDINVTKFPIVIVSGFRTGSTALGKYLSNRYNIHFFSEPFQNKNVHIYDEYKKNYISKILKNEKKFVLKFMPCQISDFNNYSDMLLEENYKIRLSRDNKVDQIASLYVAEKRNIFFKLKNDIVKSFTVPIDLKFLSLIVQIVLRDDYLLRELPYKYDLTLSYENLGFIEGTQHVLSDQPENMEEIKEEIRKILRWRWSSLKEHLVQSERFELSTPTTSR